VLSGLAEQKVAPMSSTNEDKGPVNCWSLAVQHAGDGWMKGFKAWEPYGRRICFGLMLRRLNDFISLRLQRNETFV